jgi:NDP-sugar pyrophosphorylase family protein
MNGTTLSLHDNNTVSTFHMSANPNTHQCYKTVNICSLCLEGWYKVLDKLDYYISTKNLNSYYEIVLSDLVANKTLILEGVMFEKDRWYEIDTIEDLHAADQLFNGN